MRMKREVRLSLLILVIVISSVFLLGFIGFSCEVWTHAALSGAKKVGAKLLLRVIQGTETVDLPVERIPGVERLLKPGI